jgi:hypothetical protein
LVSIFPGDLLNIFALTVVFFRRAQGGAAHEGKQFAYHQAGTGDPSGVAKAFAQTASRCGCKVVLEIRSAVALRFNRESFGRAIASTRPKYADNCQMDTIHA